jgi:glycosyltransferase involved in cell wall biosynthesis
MINNKKVVVVMPAYNAALTLRTTFNDIPFDIVDEVILVDDASTDETIAVAKELGIKHIIKHEINLGYGANQKTCYTKALDIGAEIVVMLHPDYQYDPKLIPALLSPIATGVFDVVLASRILGKGALKNGMPVYKYFFNRCLTLFQNLMLGRKISEYHSGYRAFDKKVLKTILYTANSNSFVFDNQMLLQIIYQNFDIGEISCPAKYFPEASSINFFESLCYGWGVVINTFIYCFDKMGIVKSKLFHQDNKI